MAESQCDARVAPIYKRYTDVQTTILAGAGEIQLHLKTRAASLEAAQQRVDQLAEEIEEELDDNVFSDNGDSLEQIVGYYLQMRNATLAVAESCTGGLLAERITSISGSSRYFLGGAVVYSNQLKTAFADVPGRVDRKARRGQQRSRRRAGRGYSQALRRDLGNRHHRRGRPRGGTPEKPVGLVFHALAVEKGTEVEERNFPGDRKRIRLFASSAGAGHGEKKIDVRQSLAVGRRPVSRSLAFAHRWPSPLRRFGPQALDSCPRLSANELGTMTDDRLPCASSSPSISMTPSANALEAFLEGVRGFRA